MKINYPDEILGENTKEAYDRIMAKPETQQNLEIRTNIDRNAYVKIPGTNIVIAREETNKGLNFNDTHYALADNGLYMPTVSLFMKHFMNVIAAKNNGVKLYDANNQQLQQQEADALYEKLTRNCWTWLDAMFKLENNQLYLETEHRAVIKNGNKQLIGKKSKLEDCVKEDCFVDINFNSQGFLTRKSANQKYIQGSNICFYYPRVNAVARFFAIADGAGLHCNWLALNSYHSLGVFGCAEGTAQKKS